MLRVPSGLLGRDVDLGAVDVTVDLIRAYARAIGDAEFASGPCAHAPLGFALALRGGPHPEVEMSPDTVSVHAGHNIRFERALAAPARYQLRTRLTDVFEKSGRSGALTVVVRRAQISRGDTLYAVVEDQQIVRWRPTTMPPPANGPTTVHPTQDRDAPAPSFPALEVGAQIGPDRRLAPDAQAVRAYSDWIGGTEQLFVDPGFAQGLGYRDVIVPGPMQSALLESLLRRALPGWTLYGLSVTFRLSLIAAEPIALRAVIVEQHVQSDADRLICDLAVENSDGERAASGAAELRRA